MWSSHFLRDLLLSEKPHGRILRVAFGGKRLVIRIRKLGDAQRIIQLKSGHIQVFERGDFYHRPRGELVTLRQEFDINLVVIGAQPSLLGCQRRPARNQLRRKRDSARQALSARIECGRPSSRVSWRGRHFV